MKDSGFSAFDLEHYVRLVMRQKWFIIVPAMLGLLALAGYSMTLRNQYSAKATILVEPQSIPSQFMSSALPYGPETYVRSLVEQIKSRSRLEKVIQDYSLYPTLRGKTSMEELVGIMRNQIEIEHRGQDTFSVSFTYTDPVKVQQVTNALTEMFIQENIKFRLERSEANVSFLEGQARKFRDDVSSQEKKIQAFKEQNLESLPEQRMATQAQLSAAQQRLQSNAETLMSLRARQAAVTERVGALGASSATASEGGARAISERDELSRQVAAAQKELIELKSRLSDLHPDVRAKQRELEGLEAQLARAPREPRTSGGSRVGRSPEMIRAMEERQLASAETANLETEQVRLQEEIDRLSKRLEQTPRVELQLNELTNGLEVLRSQADAFQRKATDAAASLAMEKSSQGSQFRALDKAQLPGKPVSPNRPFLVALGGVVGLLLGLGMVVGMDLLFRPFLDEQDLARFTGVQVLVSIPHVGPFPSEWQRFRGQVSNLMGYLVGSLQFRREDYVPGVPPAEIVPLVTLPTAPLRPTPGKPTRGSLPPERPVVNAETVVAHGPIQVAVSAPLPSLQAVQGSMTGAGAASMAGQVIQMNGGPRRESIVPMGDPLGRHVRQTVLQEDDLDVSEEVVIPDVEGELMAAGMGHGVLRPAANEPRVVLGRRWGEPSRYLISSSLQRSPIEPEETIKELHRRAPWSARKES